MHSKCSEASRADYLDQFSVLEGENQIFGLRICHFYNSVVINSGSQHTAVLIYYKTV